jgi:hypothetical protein
MRLVPDTGSTAVRGRTGKPAWVSDAPAGLSFVTLQEMRTYAKQNFMKVERKINFVRTQEDVNG